MFCSKTSLLKKVDKYWKTNYTDRKWEMWEDIYAWQLCNSICHPRTVILDESIYSNHWSQAYDLDLRDIQEVGSFTRLGGWWGRGDGLQKKKKKPRNGNKTRKFTPSFKSLKFCNFFSKNGESMNLQQMQERRGRQESININVERML